MGYWRRHPRKDLEEVLCEFDRLGWRIDDSAVYYRVRCPCGQHQRWVHLTPSGANYGRNALQWLKRQPCMADNQGEER